MKIENFRMELNKELRDNILFFWSSQMIDNENNGFIGRISGNNDIDQHADKGCVLNARILWTFSCAYRILKDKTYFKTAQRAKDFLLNHFFDNEYNGVYWLLDYTGKVKNDRKQIYAQAFVIYALVEYYKISGDDICLKKAIELYNLIEMYSYDKYLGGYIEAMNRDWTALEDMRLSDKDANEKKTMNTHLHILEAYTNLYRVWKNDDLQKQLIILINNFTEHIINSETNHLDLFFDEFWNCKSEIVSFGHDIEASWLLNEAARVSDNEAIINTIKKISLKMVRAASDGIQENGGMIYERDNKTNHLDTDFHWWVQAETVVGLMYAYQISGNSLFYDKAVKTWQFIKDNIIDNNQGEWFWSVNSKLEPNTVDDKAGPWKCPYHNARMCLEILENFK